MTPSPRLVFTAAVFDLLHEGHIDLLKRMRERGDLTCVILHDGLSTFRNKGRFPVDSLGRRAVNLIGTGLVDIIMNTYSTSPDEEFRRVADRYGDFDLVFMRGDDWGEFPGKSTLEELGIPIEFKPYTKGISSTSLRQQLKT